MTIAMSATGAEPLRNSDRAPKLAAVVEAERYPAARGPEGPTNFKWNFSNKTDFRYKYAQISEGVMSGFGDDKESSTKSTLAGDLVVRSQGDGTARIVLENMKAKMSMIAGNEPHEMSQDLPTTVMAGLREDGKLESSATAQQALVKLLLPLPPQSIKVGEVIDLPIDVPVNAMGSSLSAKGTTRLTNVGWVMLGKRLCVELRGSTSFLPLVIPEEVAGKYDFSMSSTSASFFDPAERRFVRAVIATSMTFGVDTPLPIPADEAQKEKSHPERVHMTMTSEDQLTLTAE